MNYSPWWLVVNAFAVYRLSILLSKDKITEQVRRWVWRRGYRRVPMEHLPGRTIRKPKAGLCGKLGRFAYELVICPWCLSMWFATSALIATEVVPTVWRLPALVLAISGLTVVATRREE